VSVELPQLPRPSNHHYFHHLKLKAMFAYTSRPVPSEMTPLLHLSSLSLPIYKENVG
jgi:hypothetical protein